ncbi:MAG: chemotaxis protein methyltransferase CheR [Alphaproteobacteria bacterium]|jgi:chemotaxis protein methyltransferase CheR|nr:chemotaxis protein methyltransferase CheR [Alphaproteobacteria bacterium]
MNRLDIQHSLADVTDEEVRRLCEFVYRKTGMMFAEEKRYYINRRLAERMEATGSTSFQAYFATLRADADNEIEHLINSFTVNETYFYREDHQFRCLTSTLLEVITPKKKAGEPIRIWSVPCSTGEEPYSIAIWLLENWDKVDRYEIEIVGSDIDTTVLRAAEAGTYSERSLMRLSKDLIARYFTRLDDGRYRILPELSSTLQFTKANIVDAGQTGAHRNFDVIFCRNILMYFDDTSRRLAAENLYESLRPGGFICLGHTESMSRITSLFDVCRFSDAIVYRRPLGESHG